MLKSQKALEHTELYLYRNASILDAPKREHRGDFVPDRSKRLQYFQKAQPDELE